MNDIEEKIAAGLQARAKREEERATKRKERELETIELEERLETELGAKGQYFDILETVEGPIAVRLGEAVLFKQYTSSKMEHEHRAAFVTACIVHPAKDKAIDVIGRRPGVLIDLSNILGALYRGKDSALEGKA